MSGGHLHRLPISPEASKRLAFARTIMETDKVARRKKRIGQRVSRGKRYISWQDEIESARTIGFTLKEILRHTEKNAKKKGLGCALTIEFLMNIYNEQNGCCAITGVPMIGKRMGTGEWNPYRPSIDRVNSAAGYSRGNVRLVTVWANVALHQWGEEIMDEFLLCRMHKKYPQFAKLCGNGFPPRPMKRKAGIGIHGEGI